MNLELHMAAVKLTKQPHLTRHYMEKRGIPVPQTSLMDVMELIQKVELASDEELTKKLEDNGLGGLLHYARMMPLKEYGVDTDLSVDRTHGWVLYGFLKNFETTESPIKGPWCMAEVCAMRITAALKGLDIPKTEENIAKTRAWLEEQP